MTRIACQQLAPVVGDFTGNVERATAAITEAIAGGAEVVVLPELCTSGYMFTDTAEAEALAIGREDPLLERWRQISEQNGTVIAAGFCELGEDGTVYNSAVLFPGGVREPVFYRKLHLWDKEKLVFEPGSELPPIVESAVGIVSMVVCYDLEFPELTRGIAIAGTQLLLVPTNWPLMERPEGERPGEVVIAMATARGNRMAVACADRAGVERGQAWTQGTAIVNADGWVVASSHDPGMVSADVDLDVALDKNWTDHAHIVNDRRPELYGALTARRS
jgi:5-aminopentanamidase